MNIEHSVLERLAFIKYLYKIATEQCRKPEPLCSASVLMFHDSIELFLQLATEKLDVERKDQSFMGYWAVLTPNLQPKELTQRESMRRLNKARVNLKHHGTRPSKLDIESFRSTTASFFEENTLTVFGIDFSQVSLVELVQNQEVRENLREAQRHLTEYKIEETMDKVAIAFHQLLAEYETTERHQKGFWPVWLDDAVKSIDCGNLYYRIGGGELTDELTQFCDKVKQSVELLTEAVKMISLGVGYRRYLRFKALTPNVVKTDDGKYHIYRYRPAPKATVEQAELCLDFVIETAVALQEFSFSSPSVPLKPH